MNGHVYKRVGKKRTSWAYEIHRGYDLQGRRLREQKGGFDTKDEARRMMNEAMHQLDNKTYVSPSTLTLETFLVNEWLPTVKQRDVKASTYASYESLVRNYIIPSLGAEKLQGLTVGRINRFYSEVAEKGRMRSDKPLAPKTTRNIHIALTKALNDAVRWSHIVRNPCEYADPPKIKGATKREMVTWNAEQLRSALEALRGVRLSPAYLLAASTGLRRGEVLGLRWQDIDLDGATLAVRQTLVSVDYRLEFTTPKNHHAREIALDKTTAAVLREWRTAQLQERLAIGELYEHDRKQDLVFTKVGGGPIHPDFLSQTFDRQVAKLDVPRIRLHDLRHTHATLALKAGVHPKVVSERLGHATVAFTLDVYSHAVKGMQADAAEAISALIWGEGS